MNTLFSHVTVLCMDEANTVLQDAYVLVKGREIAYVGPCLLYTSRPGLPLLRPHRLRRSSATAKTA